jgi:hypothetical protein
LTLELNAYSPSDSEHWFKNYSFGSNDEVNEDAPSAQKADCSWHDPKHGWINGQQVTSPGSSAILRLFERIDLRFQETLPQVSIVTCFIIRRQLRRCLPPSVLGLILDKLCCLEHLIYEPWRAWETVWRRIDDKGTYQYPHLDPSSHVRLLRYLGCMQGFLHLVQKHLPQTLKNLSIFEDFSDNLAAVLALDNAGLLWLLQVDAFRIVDPTIGTAFASRSLDLEQLSISYIVNVTSLYIDLDLAAPTISGANIAAPTTYGKPPGD